MFDPECLICCLEGGAACSVHGDVANRDDEPVTPAFADYMRREDEAVDSKVALLVAQANVLMMQAAALSKNTLPMCKVDLRRELATFYGFSTLDNFSRLQVGRIVELLRTQPELEALDNVSLVEIANKVVSRVILGDEGTLMLPRVCVDWFLGYLQMEEMRAERSIEVTRIDPVNQAKHIKRRDIYSQLRTNLARDIYHLDG
ncbi:hypothetical protein Q4Q54_10920 [Shewanella sp. SP2S2-4]|uniref:hypothetical protein n=1 Tax=Shewanella sp. SP2S2-4 TaxID=3063539 RepID=UPI0028919874|nr:hypothetical protein [Shewanella sp. SP2S2-4]MDT3273994.1 hypothetical protein [Shewanella sp. SP2S2-4]